MILLEHHLDRFFQIFTRFQCRPLCVRTR